MGCIWHKKEHDNGSYVLYHVATAWMSLYIIHVPSQVQYDLSYLMGMAPLWNSCVISSIADLNQLQWTLDCDRWLYQCSLYLFYNEILNFCYTPSCPLTCAGVAPVLCYEIHSGWYPSAVMSLIGVYNSGYNNPLSLSCKVQQTKTSISLCKKR
jgi:hypothetical protein